MRKNTHPKVQKIEVSCVSCHKVYNFLSTASELEIDVCANCHPYYLGTTLSLRSAGQVDRFKNRLAKHKKLQSKTKISNKKV